MTSDERLAYRTCPLCEATCGLEISVRDGEVARIRGDRADVFSAGYICPKGSTLRQLRTDPDRLRRPLMRRDGELVEVSWDEAFAEIERRLVPIIEEHGRDAVGAYLGNPNVHNLDGQIYGRVLLRALGSTNVFSASTVDQMPKQIACGLMFGAGLSVPIPDIDRTDRLLILGANPLASNGSLMTAPDFPGRLAAIGKRGGRVVVVDPRRTETADIADEWVPIRPGGDAFLLAAMTHTLFAEELVDLGVAGQWVVGVEEVRRLVEPFTPEAVAGVTGIEPDTIRRLTREQAAAPSAAVYGRMGTCTQEFGTLASWLVDVVNTLTGNLDRPGGVMFTRAAAGASNTAGEPGTGRGIAVGRRKTRVRGLPEAFGELPVVALAEEIETPGQGQIRALVTVAGNPVLSTPNSDRLDAALDSLEFMVSVDIYLNETTRHADVILPVPDALSRPHYDLAFYQLAVRNIARFSPPVFDVAPDSLHEWEILARLALIVSGAGAQADVAVIDEMVIADLADRAVRSAGSNVVGRDPAELVAASSTGGRRGPARILDLMLRTGPYGDGYGAYPDGLSLDRLLEHPHGVDLGALQPRLPEMLRTPSGRVELAPAALVSDVARLVQGLNARAEEGSLVLVGRRHVRSNNSWMHNVEVLVKGKERCTLQISPVDAERLGVSDGEVAEVSSRAGKVVAPVEVTSVMTPGVVSLPHGWGHDLDGIQLSVAQSRPGVNVNVLTDETFIDPLSGNAALNGIRVTVSPA